MFVGLQITLIMRGSVYGETSSEAERAAWRVLTAITANFH
jgi:hypothetical protein